MKPVESIERDLNLTFQTYIPKIIKSLLEKKFGVSETDRILKTIYATGRMAKCIKSVVDSSTVKILKFYYNIEQLGDEVDDETDDETDDEDEDGLPF